jgi:hypothetical protein
MPWAQPVPRDPDGPARRRTASSAYWGNQRRPVKARTDAELGEQVRNALWKFAGRTSLRGVARDRAAVALIRNRVPAAKGVFSDAQLAAVLREKADGSCSWCALRVLTAAGDEPMPDQPTPGLLALLGRPCARCRVDFDAGKVAARERRLLASGYRRRVVGPQPTGAIWPAGKEPPGLTAAARAGARRKPDPPSYYRPSPGRLPRE